MTAARLERPGFPAASAIDARGAAVPREADPLAVGAGALQPHAPLGTTTPRGPRAEGLPTPPAPAALVTLREADRSLNALLSMALGDDAPEQRITREDIENMSMASYGMFLVTLNAKYTGQLTELKLQALQIYADATEAMREAQAKAMLAQGENVKAQQAQVQLASNYELVGQAAVSLVNQISAIWKFRSGNFVGMAADMLAGWFGAVKFFAHVTARVVAATSNDQEWSEKWIRRCNNVADFVGKGERLCMTASVVVDGASAARTIASSKLIGQATGKMFAHAGRKELPQTCGQNFVTEVIRGQKPAIETAANEVAKVVANNVAGAVRVSLSQGRGAMLGSAQFFEAFSKKAIEEMVTRGLVVAAEKAVKSVGTGCTKTLGREIAREGAKQARRQAYIVAGKAAFWSSPNAAKRVTQALVTGGVSVGKGVIAREQAKLIREAQELAIETDFLQFLIEDLHRKTQQAYADIKHINERHADVVRSGGEILSQNGSVLQNIANIGSMRA